MCGIAGFFSWSGQAVDHDRLKIISDSLKHRGPDGSGQWFDSELRIGLVHRRLSIIDLDPSAGQPMTFAGRYTIVYNGEIYNYLELREKLIGLGLKFSTRSDTEVILGLFQVYGSEMLSMLDGMFAIAIWDSVERTLFCARDRFGEKPFYFANTSDGFYFASEMKALWAAGVPKDPDPRRIYRYLAYGQISVPGEFGKTFYQGIEEMKPAHWMKVEAGRIGTQTRYWTLDISSRPVKMGVGEACEQFLNIMMDSIRLRLRSDVPVGSSLSGGLDSSTIVSLIHRIKGPTQVQKTFSARFGGYVKDEGQYIDELTRQLQCEAYAVFLEPEKLLEQFDSVAFHQEEPFGGTSVIAQWEVMKLAHTNGVKVLLDGQGADELLAGYHYFFFSHFRDLLRRDFSGFVRQSRAYEELHGIRINNRLSLVADSFLPALRNSVRNLRNKLHMPGYLRQFNTDFAESHRIYYESPIDRGLTASLNRALNGGELQVLLRYADRNSMAHGREVRLPFLSHRLVEFVFSLPDEMKIRDGWTKFLLRSAMSDILPESICWRREKIGFEPPRQKKIQEDRVQDSISVLADQRIVSPSTTDPSKSWEYVQAAHLFNPSV